jgi:hypothetical protein
LNIFHQVEKWNGQFYQQGALWQVRVKIFVGHNGDTCLNNSVQFSDKDIEPTGNQFINTVYKIMNNCRCCPKAWTTQSRIDEVNRRYQRDTANEYRCHAKLDIRNIANTDHNINTCSAMDDP